MPVLTVARSLILVRGTPIVLDYDTKENYKTSRKKANAKGCRTQKTINKIQFNAQHLPERTFPGIPKNNT